MNKITILMAVLAATSGLSFLTTTPVFAAQQCQTESDGSITCTGGTGGRTKSDGSGTTTTSGNPAGGCEAEIAVGGGSCEGGRGGRITTSDSTLEGGSGGQEDTCCGEIRVGGGGGRSTGGGSVGGEGEHFKG